LEKNQRIIEEKVTFGNQADPEATKDTNGNIIHRLILPPGETIVTQDALVEVSPERDDFNHKSDSVPVETIPTDTLRYILPSRYCDSDKLLDFSNTQFGFLPSGRDRVIAICNWVHGNIKYITYSGRSDISASEIITRGYGVCRDFAHVAIALCRALNIPARYVTGHLPDIGCFDPGTPMDFHAYFEVYLEHQWCIFDARFNTPRIGRVKVAHGLDAVDTAFSTTYGESNLTSFEVWAYQIDPKVVSIGDPIDLSKRLDGTPEVRLS